jgi:hypothetical protein
MFTANLLCVLFEEMSIKLHNAATDTEMDCHDHLINNDMKR